MSRILITNGDHAANALAAHFPDAEILIWRDVLIEGPVPGGIDDDTLADIRAKHIEEAFGMQNVREEFTRRDLAFARLPQTGRIELWFETDLHDQLQLIQLLARFARQSHPELWLTLAPPPLLNSIDRMTKELKPVSNAQIVEGAALWDAFRSPDPGAVLEASSAGGALPEARNAFARILEEYPHAEDGLGRIERKALEAIRDGAITPGLAFRHYQQTEMLPFLGDLGFYYRLDALQRCAAPLLVGLPEGGIASASRNNKTVEYMHTAIELTDSGYSVLECRADHARLNEIDRWIGGVHLTSGNAWRSN